MISTENDFHSGKKGEVAERRSFMDGSSGSEKMDPSAFRLTLESTKDTVVRSTGRTSFISANEDLRF